MRIVYLVDVHDRFDAVPRTMEQAGPADLLLIGGDVTTGGTPDDAAHAVESWLPLAPRLLAVAGNMDSAAIDDRLAELGVALDGRGVRFGDLGVFGASAAPISPLHTPYELTDDELERRLEQGFSEVEASRLTLCCPHAPPHDTACDRLASGEHVGSAAVRAFVERRQPDLVLCGHIHEARAEDRIGRSRIVNPGPARDGYYAVVEANGELTFSLATF